MPSKRIIISINEVDDMKLVGLRLEEVTKEDAIVIFNRCINQLLSSYDMKVDVIERDNSKPRY